MSRVSTLLIVLLVASFPHLALSAPLVRTHLEGGGTLALAPHDYKEYQKNGFGIAGGIEVGRWRNLSLCADVEWNANALNTNAVASSLRQAILADPRVPQGSDVGYFTFDGGEMSFLTALAGVKLETRAVAGVVPYLKAEAGVGRITTARTVVGYVVLPLYHADGAFARAEREDRFAASFALGARQGGSGYGGLGEVRWTTLMTDRRILVAGDPDRREKKKPYEMIALRAGLYFDL